MSATLPPIQQQVPTKKTDQVPSSNILQSYNRQWNSDNENKFKQDEVGYYTHIHCFTIFGRVNFSFIK